MKVGFFVPINYLNLCCTKVYPCYAKFVITSNKYLNFYRSKKGTGTVILDTSPVLPRQNNLDVLYQGMKEISPDLVVLPSRDYSYDKTIGLAQSFIRKCNGRGEFIGVLQGVTLETLNECYEELKDYCSAIALPSNLESIAKRAEISRDLHIKGPLVYIEVYSNPYEEVDKDSKSTTLITSFPIRLAYDLRELAEFTPTPPPLNYEMEKEELMEELAQENIDEYMEVVSG